MKKRKIFLVMAGGGHETDRHYFDTIQNKRSVPELSKFLKSEEVKILENFSKGRPYAVWGAVPGTSNVRNWETMDEGDYVMVYRKGRIILAAEIAMKVRNPALAEYLWKKDESGKTWELIYFLMNDVSFSVSMVELNKYLGYKAYYHPQGFMAVQQDKADKALSMYGDLISLLSKLQKGEHVEEIDPKRKVLQTIDEIFEDKVEKAPTEHTEMQWRLARLGNRAKFDVWVPENDKNREWDGERLRDMVIEKFHETIDVPSYIKHIDTVWKLGHSIKSAFEVENSTSIYSGILRLSDLKALAPNSNYPLFIVAQREKKNKVFEQLRRPTFSNDYLAIDRAVKFLSYDAVRELDLEFKGGELNSDINWLLKRAESVHE